MAEVTDRNVLSDIELEVTASRGEQEGAGDGWSPDDIAIDNPLDVLQHWIPMVADLCKLCIFIGPQQNGIRPIHPDQPQLA